MDVVFVTPSFGGRLRPEPYYAQLNYHLRTMRKYYTLRVIAEKLNAANLTTPSGLAWDRARVSAYLKTNNINKGA